MARLVDVMSDEGAPSEVFRLLTDEGAPRTLAQIAKAWAVPRGRFVEWFTTKHADRYDAALKVLADQLAHEALEIADEQKEAVRPDGSKYDSEVPRDKFRAETRLKIAARWDRDRYGDRPALSEGMFEEFAATLQRISERKHLALKQAQGQVVDAEVVSETSRAVPPVVEAELMI